MNRVEMIEKAAQAIRVADGNHTMGAGALAEVVVDALLPQVATVEELEELREEVSAERKNHADLTSRMGFGDGVTEPQADNDTIMRAWDEMSSQSMEWLESQSWRTDCYLAGHPDGEDCHEHDPALRLLNAEAEVDRLRAQIAALMSALERTEANFRAAVRGLPVRDMAENLAENRAALASGDEVQP